MALNCQGHERERAVLRLAAVVLTTGFDALRNASTKRLTAALCVPSNSLHQTQAQRKSRSRPLPAAATQA